MESAAREKPADFVSLLPAIEAEAQTVLGSLQSLRPRDPIPPVQSDAAGNGATFDSAAWREGLSRLRGFVADSDLSGSSSLATELAARPAPAEISGAMAEIASLVDGYEFDEAITRLDSLLKNPLL